MWTISGVKALGKQGYQRDYWRTVLMALIAAVLGGGLAGGSAFKLVKEIDFRDLSHIEINFPANYLWSLFGIVAGVAVFGWLFNLAFRFFASNPLSLGVSRYMLLHTEQSAGLGELGYGFSNDYLSNVKTLFLRDLYIFLWSLLFVIPGIVKAYAYRLVPYILAEHPEMSAREALETSNQLMKGHKWHTFLLDFSFIGWYLLSAITAGIVGALIVAPYQQMTNAYLFKVIAYPGAHQEAPYENPYEHSEENS